MRRPQDKNAGAHPSPSTSTPTGKGAHPRDRDDAPPPKGRQQEHRPAPRRPRQAKAQSSANPAGTTGTRRRLPLRHQPHWSPRPGSHIFPSPSTPTGKGAHPQDRDGTTQPKRKEQEHRPAPRRQIPIRPQPRWSPLPGAHIFLSSSAPAGREDNLGRDFRNTGRFGFKIILKDGL